MDFEEAYRKFVEHHLKRSSPTRMKRLEKGLGHAEHLFLFNVWWPAFGQFEHLHPEYEIRDYTDGYRYIDFAYIESHFRLAIEIDGFEWHWQSITQDKFRDHLARQNALLIDDWRLLRFSYDSVRLYPRTCQQTLQQMLGRGRDAVLEVSKLSLEEREILRLSSRRTTPITVKQVCDWLNVRPKHAQELLRGLAEKHWLEPASGKLRITSYTLDVSRHGVSW